MIRFGNNHTEKIVRNMWKICFDDDDNFIDFQFSRKYKNENTLIFFDGEEAAASLQMFPYSITFYGVKVSFYYLAGLCTLPQHRKKGYMALLIHKAHEIMKERNIPLSILVPAEEWLFGFYEKYGYEQVFEKNDKPIFLKKLLDKYPDRTEAYKAFNSLIEKQDFHVQKTLDDFQTIIDENKLENFAPKYNLSAMVRIINPMYLLKLYAYHQSKNRTQSDTRIKVYHEGQTTIYHINNGNVTRDDKGNSFDIEADIRLLCRLLFGYKTELLPSPYSDLFPSHHPVINMMLE